MKASCKRRVGIFQGIYHESATTRMRAFAISCGSWSCPDCRETKARALWARAMRGQLQEAAERKGFRVKYQIKLLTLTVPGKAYRNSHTPLQAWEHIARSFDKLIRALVRNPTGLTNRQWARLHPGERKPVGKFKYVKVYELQTDGFPHLHVLLVGEAISAKETLHRIDRLWRSRYGMGFVKLNEVKGKNGKEAGIKQALSYVLKYMFKGLGEDEDEMKKFKGKRRYSVSREVLARDEKSGVEYVAHRIRFGSIDRFFGIEFGEVCIEPDERGVVDYDVKDHGYGYLKFSLKGERNA